MLSLSAEPAAPRAGEVHPLGALLRAVADRRFAPADGQVEVVPPYLPGVEAMVSLTAHAVASTRLPRRLLEEAGADGYAGATSAAVMALLAGRDGEVDVLDALLVSRGTGWTALPERRDLDSHPRVRYARHRRGDVHVHGDDRGLVTVGRGIGGLPELSFEVVPGRRGWGLGRALLREARGLVPEGEPVLVAVAPGNAASVRAALAAGFEPIGSVQLVRPGPSRLRPAGPRRSDRPAAAAPALGAVPQGPGQTQRSGQPQQPPPQQPPEAAGAAGVEAADRVEAPARPVSPTVGRSRTVSS